MLTLTAFTTLMSPEVGVSPIVQYNYELNKFVKQHNESFIKSTKNFDKAIEEYWISLHVVDIRKKKNRADKKEKLMRRADDVEKEIMKMLEQWRKVKASLEAVDREADAY